MRNSKRINFIVNVVFWGLILGLAYLLFKYFINLVMPFLVALIMASLARPIAKWMSRTTRKKRLPDGTVTVVTKQYPLAYNIAAIITVILLYVVLAAVVIGFVLPFISILTDRASMVPSFFTDTLRPLLVTLNGKLDTVTGTLSEPVASMLSDVSSGLLSSLGSLATNISGKVIGWASSFVTSLPSAILTSVICLIASVFLAIDLDSIGAFIKLNLPERTYNAVESVKRALTGIVWQFVRSYFIIFLITWAELSTGLLLVGQGYAVLIALLIAIFDAFPIVGSGMIMLPWSVITLLTGDTKKGIFLFLIYAVVVGARQIIEPRIVGHQVGLRPIVTLFCMYLGNKLFGGLGLFILPITAAILVSLNTKYSLFRLPGSIANAAGTPETPSPEPGTPAAPSAEPGSAAPDSPESDSPESDSPASGSAESGTPAPGSAASDSDSPAANEVPSAPASAPRPKQSQKKKQKRK